MLYIGETGSRLRDGLWKHLRDLKTTNEKMSPYKFQNILHLTGNSFENNLSGKLSLTTLKVTIDLKKVY